MRGSQASREEGELRRPVRALRSAAPRLCLRPPLVCTRARTQATPAHLESVVASPPVCSWRSVGAVPSVRQDSGLLPSLLKPLRLLAGAQRVLSAPAAG